MSVGPIAGPVDRRGRDRDLRELFKRVEDLERVQRKALPYARLVAGAQTFNGTSYVQQWDDIVTNYPNIFEIDGGDNTKVRALQAGAYWLSGYARLNIDPATTMTDNIVYDTLALIVGEGLQLDIFSAGVTETGVGSIQLNNGIVGEVSNLNIADRNFGPPFVFQSKVRGPDLTAGRAESLLGLHLVKIA